MAPTLLRSRFIFLPLSIAIVMGISACSGGGSSPQPAATQSSSPSNPSSIVLYPDASGMTTIPSGAVGVSSADYQFTVPSGQTSFLVVDTAAKSSTTLTVTSAPTPTASGAASVPATASFAGKSTATGTTAVLNVAAGGTPGTVVFTISDGTNTASLLVGLTESVGSFN